MEYERSCKSGRVFCFDPFDTGFDRAKPSTRIENMKISCVFPMEGCPAHAGSHPQRQNRPKQKTLANQGSADRQKNPGSVFESKRLVIHFHILTHLWNPPALDEVDMVRVSVIDLIVLYGGKLHGKPELIVVLPACLPESLEIPDRWNGRQDPGGLEEITLGW